MHEYLFLDCLVTGKERVFMSVATMLDKKVYVEKSKWKMMVTILINWFKQVVI